jgi:DNA helicase-2/ATP-dependent DNA helicase PcrA
LQVANAIIARNKERHHKVLRSRPDSLPGELPELFVHEGENEETDSVATEIMECIRQGYARRDIAVLYRSNSQGALLEVELRRHHIPYLMSGGTAFFDRKETRDILAYLRCSLHPHELAFRRILNTPPRGIGDKTIETLGEQAEDRRIPFIEAARRWREAGVDEKAGARIDSFFKWLEGFVPALLRSQAPPGESLLRLFSEMGYKQHLEKMSSNALIASKRWRFVELFAGILDRQLEQNGRTTTALKDFLDNMELRDALQDREENEDRVQLLTLHACKGLEFPVVFLVGLEEDIIPHRMLGTDIAEERRLLYVGVTRAQKRLVLSRVQKRRKHGKWVTCAPSRFLLEIPENLLRDFQGPRPVREELRKSMVAELYKKLDAMGAQPLPRKT